MFGFKNIFYIFDKNLKHKAMITLDESVTLKIGSLFKKDKFMYMGNKCLFGNMAIPEYIYIKELGEFKFSGGTNLLIYTNGTKSLMFK